MRQPITGAWKAPADGTKASGPNGLPSRTGYGAGGLPPADALSAWIILRSHIHSPCWQELPTTTEILLALRPPAALARRTRARNGPEAFVLSDGALQAPVGRPSPTIRLKPCDGLKRPRQRQSRACQKTCANTIGGFHHRLHFSHVADWSSTKFCSFAISAAPRIAT